MNDESSAVQRLAAERTLARMRAYVETILPPERHAAVLRVLDDLPVASLAAMNPIQADDEVEIAIERTREAVAPRRTATVVCASRPGKAALAQARWVAARLAQRGTATTIVEPQPGAAAADYTVRPCSELAGGDAARVVAFTERRDARDAFCSARFPSFEALPQGARVGARGACRQAQLAAIRPDARYEAAGEDLPAALLRLQDGGLDALVVPVASLDELHARPAHTIPFSPEAVVPAAGQGALAVEVPAGGRLAGALREALNDGASERCVRCELAAVAQLDPGADAAVYATLEGDRMTARGALPAAGGIVRARVDGMARTVREAEELGAGLGRALTGRPGPEGSSSYNS